MSLRPIRTGPKPKRASYSSMGGNWQFENKRRFPSKKKIIGISLISILVFLFVIGDYSVPSAEATHVGFNQSSVSHTRTVIYRNIKSDNTQWNFNSTCVTIQANDFQFAYTQGTAGTGGSNCNSQDLLLSKAPVNLQSVSARQLEMIVAWASLSSDLGPFDSYALSNRDGDDTMAVGGNEGQCFNAGFTGNLDNVKFALQNGGSPDTGIGVVRIYATTGTYGTSCVRTGSALAVSDNFDISTLTSSYQFITFSFSGANRISLTSGTKFAAAFWFDSGTGSVLMGTDISSPTHAGNAFIGVVAQTYDLPFEANSLSSVRPLDKYYLGLRTNGTLPNFRENYDLTTDRDVRLIWEVCPKINPSCGNGNQSIFVVRDSEKSSSQESRLSDLVITSSAPDTIATNSVLFQTVLNFTGPTNLLNQQLEGSSVATLGTNTTASGLFQQGIDYYLLFQVKWKTDQAPSGVPSFTHHLVFGRQANSTIPKSIQISSVPAVCQDRPNLTTSICAPPSGFTLSDLKFDLLDPSSWANAIIKGLGWIFLVLIPTGFVITTLATLRFLQDGFNAIGNFFGWGNIGDGLATFLSAMGALLTGGLATVSAWIIPFVNRALDFITFVNVLFNSIMNSVLDFLTLMKTVASMVVTVFSYFVFVGPVAFMVIDFVFYFVFVAQDGLSGFAMWFRWNKWAAFAFLNLASRIANIMISLIGWLIARVPTLSGTHLPKFPHIESGEIPAFKLDFGIPSIRKGDATSAVLLIAGFTVFVIWLGSTSGPFSAEIQGRISPVQNIFQPIITISMLLLVFILPAELIQRLTGTVKQRF